MLGEAGTYLFTNVYSPQRLEDKLQLLDNLSRLQHRHPNAKAIYGGDFNMITSLGEKKGWIRTLKRDVEAFTSFIRTSNLVDI